MNIEEKVIEILEKNSKLKHIDSSRLKEITVHDLGVNSLNFIKIIVELEDAFDIEFDDDQINYDLLNNIYDLVVLINEKIPSDKI